MARELHGLWPERVGYHLETLEDIPVTGTTFRLGNMTIEILQTHEQAVKTARITVMRDPESPDDEQTLEAGS